MYVVLACLYFAHNCTEHRLRLLLSGSKSTPVKIIHHHQPCERVESDYETRGIREEDPLLILVVIRVLSWYALLYDFASNYTNQPLNNCSALYIKMVSVVLAG